MRRLVSIVILTLGLVAVALFSAVWAMRLAIHGSEVAVPKLIGLTSAEAQRIAVLNGLLLVRENRFYSSTLPEGKIINQIPEPGARVRRGWRIRVAESLGPQRAVIPSLIGQSARAAEINIRRRGLDLGAVAIVHLPGTAADQVVAQSPPVNAGDILSPKVDLLLAAAELPPQFVMPHLLGERLVEAAAKVEAAGLRLGKIYEAQTLPETVPQAPAPEANSAGATPAGANLTGPPATPHANLPPLGPTTTPGATVIRQIPAAGQKIEPDAIISLEVMR